MSFRMRPEVDEWFSRIAKAKDSPLATKFDYYYLCLMMGFGKGTATSPTAAVEFVPTFINAYRPTQNLIIGLLVAAEANLQGIDLTNRAAIKKLLALYVSPEPSVGLTADGFQRVNDYANGGFNCIVAGYPESPWVAADFLEWYTRELDEAVSQNKWWSSPSAFQTA
jgi:hypothetical protein